MKKVALISALMLLISTQMAVANAAGDIKNGEKLHKNCFGCHDQRMYTRPNRIIHSFPDLKNRVRFCETNNGLEWNSKEIEDVATYLNQKYYKF